MEPLTRFLKKWGHRALGEIRYVRYHGPDGIVYVSSNLEPKRKVVENGLSSIQRRTGPLLEKACVEHLVQAVNAEYFSTSERPSRKRMRMLRHGSLPTSEPVHRMEWVAGLWRAHEHLIASLR